MPSAYNLAQKDFNMALAYTMLLNPPPRENRKTKQVEHFPYDIQHVKNITKLNRTELGIVIAEVNKFKEDEAHRISEALKRNNEIA